MCLLLVCVATMYVFIHIFPLFFVKPGVALLGGQGRHLPTQFFRDQRQKIIQNCKIRATCLYPLQMLSNF